MENFFLIKSPKYVAIKNSIVSWHVIFEYTENILKVNLKTFLFQEREINPRKKYIIWSIKITLYN